MFVVTNGHGSSSFHKEYAYLWSKEIEADIAGQRTRRARQYKVAIVKRAVHNISDHVHAADVALIDALARVLLDAALRSVGIAP